MCKNCNNQLHQQPATETAASAAIVPHRLPTANDADIQALAKSRPWELPLHRVGGEEISGSVAAFRECWAAYLAARNLSPVGLTIIRDVAAKLLRLRLADIRAGLAVGKYVEPTYVERDGCGIRVSASLCGKAKPVKALFKMLRDIAGQISLPALGAPTDGERARFGNAIDLMVPRVSHFYAAGVASDGIFWGSCDFGQSNSCWWSRDGYLEAWSALAPDAGGILFFDGAATDAGLENLGLSIADVGDYSARELWKKLGQSCDCGRVWCAQSDCGNIVFFNQYLPDGLELPQLLAQYSPEQISRTASLRCELYVNSDACRTWANRSSFALSTEMGGSACACCGCYVSDDEAYYANDECYCESCFSYNYCFCSRCGEATDNDDCQQVNGDNYWCESCRDRYASQCAQCGEWVTERNATTVDGECWCENCAESGNVRCCDSCGEYVTDFSRVSTDGSEEHWCQDCADGLPECFDCECLVNVVPWKSTHAVLAGDGATVPDQPLCHDCANSYSQCACGRLDYPSAIDDGGCCDICAAAIASIDTASRDMVSEGAPSYC